ncbi:MAG: DegT/DnrJ/EryC1/StrS family aminotransferase, partial [Actinomycetota bacterium]|nr:DegT/DnrJ/EryC1/StrS family aminotransferase [Actinomycetota bacterium]
AGLPVDLSRFDRGNRVVIEDAAHALGAHTAYGPVGNCAHSDMCCFSTHPVKPITTGEGGLVTTNDDELAARLRRFRSHGIIRRSEHGEWFYDIAEVGFNYRMTDIQAALGASQLGRIDEFIERRNEIALAYRRGLSGLPIELPPSAPDGVRHGYHLFPIAVENRAEVFHALRDRGIGVQVHYVPVHHHPISAHMGFGVGDLPVCDALYERLISLPIHPGLSTAHFDRVLTAIRAALGKL